MKRLLLSLVLSAAVLSACGGSKMQVVEPVLVPADQNASQGDTDTILPSENNQAKNDQAEKTPVETPSAEPVVAEDDGGSKTSDAGQKPAESEPDVPGDSGKTDVAISVPDSGGGQGVVTSLDQKEFEKAAGAFGKTPAGGAVAVPSSGRIHVFSLVKDGGGYFSGPHSFLYHVSVDKTYKGALWGSAAAGQYIPAPYEGDKLLDLNESPAVTRTKTATHIVSRSGDKIVYWECANGLLDAASQDGGQIKCAKKVVNNGDNANVQGCIAITSDPYGRVYIFAKHNPSGRLEIYQGTGIEDMHSAGSIFSAAEIQSCPAAAYHPALNRVYVFSSHDGDLFAGVSGKVSGADSDVAFYESGMKAAHKFNGGMASCGENGRLTTVYDPATQLLSILHHEKGESNTIIQSLPFENEQTGVSSSSGLLQRTLSHGTDSGGDDIDDFPVGIYDELGVLHAFGDKAGYNGLYEGEKAADGIHSYQVADNEIQVERAPAAVFDPESKVIHLFARSSSSLAHFVKKRRPDGSWSPWHAEALSQGIDFQGCPAAFIEN